MSTIIRRQKRLFMTQLFAFSCCLSLGTQVVAALQENEEGTSSRREEAAIKAVEEAGGRVYQISAADESREVSCYLASNPIEDQHLESIGAISKVIWLNLANTEISNDGLKSIAKLPLTKLHLEKTKIGDDGLQHLKSLKDLEYLNLYGTQVTDAGLDHLKELKKLKKLYVWQTGVTEAGMKKLNEALPELEIIGEVKLTPVVVEEPKAEEKKDPPAAEKKADANSDKAAKPTDGAKSDQAAKPTDKKAAAGKKQRKGKKKAAAKTGDGDQQADDKTSGN